MKTTVEALKDYYVEIGGTSTDVEDVVTIPDMIDAITALGGGSSLPEVTADDNGDVLTVVGGEWNKAAPSEAPFKIVEATSNNGTITFSNETQKSLYQYATSGKFLIVFDKTEFRIYICYGSGGTGLVDFLYITRTSNKTYYYTFVCRSDNTSNSTTVSSYSSDDYRSGPT